jgi:hypothetical protein
VDLSHITEADIKKMSKAKKRELLELVSEMERRYQEDPLKWYVACCTTHAGRKPDNWPQSELWRPTRCPTFPCLESKHTKFHKSMKRMRVVFGGNRSAKTFTCNKEFLFRMTWPIHPFTGQSLRKGNRHGRILAQDFALHEKKHIPEVKEWIPLAALRGYKPGMTRAQAWEGSYDSRNHILHLVEDGWIDFLTYDQDPSKGESVDLDIWFADEEIPEDWYNACNSRLVSRGGIGIMGVTPLYGLTWAMRFLDDVDPNAEVFKWGIRDNPHNSEKAISEFLASVSPLERESRENGDFIEFKGRRYKELDQSVHLLNESKQPQPGWPVVMAMDPHQRKGTAITWSFVDPNDTIVFFDEMEIQGTAAEVVAAIRNREASHKARTAIRVIDPAGNKQVSGYGSQRTTLNEFEECGMYFTLADNSDAGYNVVSEYLRWDKTKPLSSLNRPSVYFTQDCPKTWYGLSHLMWDEYKFNTNRDAKEKVRDKDKDFPDCVRYTLVLRPSFSSRNSSPVELSYRTDF